ncbi:hypothetical protein K439DRAFT_1346685, partial [Ramaria rubella]
QEPYINFLGNSISSPHWFSVYPKLHYSNNSITHSLILVNKHIATTEWEIIDLDTADIMAIRMRTPTGNLLIFNIYNNNVHSKSLDVLHSFIQG